MKKKKSYIIKHNGITYPSILYASKVTGINRSILNLAILEKAKTTTSNIFEVTVKNETFIINSFKN